MAEYIQERQKVTVLCDINEPKQMKIGGLRDDIREKLGGWMTKKSEKKRVFNQIVSANTC